jgi:hypothetical protein
MSRELTFNDSWKYNVHAASTANVDLSSINPIIDGYQTKNGDRVLLKNQTNTKTNGIYIINRNNIGPELSSLNNTSYNLGATIRVMYGVVNGLKEFYIAPITPKNFLNSEKIFIASPFSGSGANTPIPNNPYDFYLDGTVAVGGDGSIESPFKTLTELNDAVLLLPPNANLYTAYVLPDTNGYGNEVVGELNIAENLNLIGVSAPNTSINCALRLTSTGSGGGSNVVTYKNIALNNIFTLDLTLSTFAFISLIDGQYNLTRIDNNTNANVNLQGGLIITNIDGGNVNLSSCLIFGDVNVSGGATLYSVNTQLYGGIFKLVGNCTLKTLSTLNPFAGYVDGTVNMSGTPSWITDTPSNETYTGTLNRTILDGSDIYTTGNTVSNSVIQVANLGQILPNSNIILMLNFQIQIYNIAENSNNIATFYKRLTIIKDNDGVIKYIRNYPIDEFKSADMTLCDLTVTNDISDNIIVNINGSNNGNLNGGGTYFGTIKVIK